MSNQVINYIDSEFLLLCSVETKSSYYGFQGAVKAFYTLNMIDKKTMVYLIESSTEAYYE